MRIDSVALCAMVLAFTATTATAANGDRVFLRNDARLVQSIKGDVMTLRCERMGGTEIKVKRWVRDCNTLARWELERMKREGQLGDTKLASEIQAYVRTRMPEWRGQYPGVESLNLAVMGCIVNGPGESKHADIGISLPGTGEAPTAPVFIDGKKAMTLRGANIAAEFKAIVEDYVARRYGQA